MPFFSSLFFFFGLVPWPFRGANALSPCARSTHYWSSVVNLVERGHWRAWEWNGEDEARGPVV